MDLTKVKQIVAEIESRQKILNDECKTVLEQAFKEVFDKYPKLESIRWLQYTDYFCDGDPCYFSVRADVDWSLNLNGGSHDDWYTQEYDVNTRTYKEIETSPEATLTYKEFNKIGQEVSDIIYSIPSDTMLAIYGDHAEVIVNRKGSTVEDYSHHD